MVMRATTLKRLWRIRRLRPFIDITESGQATDSPKVHVGFNSRTGMCGALTFPATDSGHARASSYARHYANILGLPVADRRRNPEVMSSGAYLCAERQLSSDYQPARRSIWQPIRLRDFSPTNALTWVVGLAFCLLSWWALISVAGRLNHLLFH